jgi:predicted RNase H-like HicB family nuclease
MSGDNEKNLKSYYEHIEFQDGYYAFVGDILGPFGPAKTPEEAMELIEAYLDEK